MIRATVRTEAALAKLQQVKAGVTRAALNSIVQRVALVVFAEAVAMTPVRWFGQVRASWRFVPTETGALIRNPHRVFLFLDQGTANQGTGYIFPRVKKFLYIPKTQAAAAGWHEGLRRGIDYVLARKVRGIKPLHILDRLKVRSRALLLQDFKNYIRELIARPAPPTQSGLASPVPTVLNTSGALSSGLATNVSIELLQQPKLPFLR